jgi:hypothetical protein
MLPYRGGYGCMNEPDINPIDNVPTAVIQGSRRGTQPSPPVGGVRYRAGMPSLAPPPSIV